jgi:hypothetical protein
MMLRRAVLTVLTSALIATALAPALAVSSTGTILATQGCTVGVQRPKSIVFACGDFGAFVNKIHWRTWGGSTAVGTGIYTVQTCTPNCAMGGTNSVSATIRLSKTGACPGKHHKYYRRASLALANGGHVINSVPCPIKH